MKKASKVFIIIGFICSLLIIGQALVFMVVFSNSLYTEIYTISELIYGVYAFITSIGSLKAIKGTSKTRIIIWGIFYIPVMLIASIFMFCIKEEDLY